MEWDDSIKEPVKQRQKLEQLIKDKPDDPKGYYDLAVVCEYLKDEGKALEYCEKAVSLYPDESLYYAFLVFLTVGYDSKKALDALVKFIELVPDESDYYTERVIDELCYVDNDFAVEYIKDLRAQGKEGVACKIEKWIWNP
jgi:tetratricopeptide (TPR) repeat protein